MITATDFDASAIANGVAPAPLPCPFCLGALEHTSPLHCVDCGREPPLRYAKLFPPPQPMPLQMIGWRGHGKTSYLHALMLVLSRLPRVWPTYAFSPATEESRALIERANATTASGALPEASPDDLTDPFVLLMHGLPRWGGTRALLLRDVPGSCFDLLALPHDKLPLLHRGSTALMLFSLADLEDSSGRTMAMLLDSYAESLLECGVRLEQTRPKLVVVLTKGDCVTPPPEVNDYLMRDPIWALLGPPASDGGRFDVDAGGDRLSSYLSGMGQAHQAITAWLARTDMGANFIRLADHYRIRVRFTFVSATGGAALEHGRLGGAWQPRRIINPLLWALELDAESF